MTSSASSSASASASAAPPSASCSFECSLEAYAGIVAHAGKYPSRAVYGALLGRKTGDKVFGIHLAVPICHAPPSAVVLELALTQIADYAGTSGMSVVGCYYGPERLSGKRDEMDVHAELLACKIQAQFPEACALVVDNALFASDDVAVQLLRRAGRAAAWESKGAPIFDVNDEASVGKLNASIGADAERLDAFFDFEDHLDEVSRPWLAVPVLGDSHRKKLH